MLHYFPMPAFPDTMPIDISHVFEQEKPAGKHGFVRVDGEDLRFEDGTLAKFWGVNFNGAACFPSKEYAQNVARRLAQTGCNVVRFHQLDAEFGTPNIFAFTKGRHLNTTRRLDPQSMDRLDYLIYCLKQEGIYLYLDMLTYRQFKEGDGVMDAYGLGPAAKPWCLIDPILIELQKEYATQLWTHVNPYTGLAYCDDPAFILTEIVNECDLFTINDTIQYEKPENTYYNRQMREKFRDWLLENHLEYDWAHCDLKSQDQEMIDFKLYLTDKYYSQMYQHLRDIGVKIPITGTNWICRGYDFHASHKNMDFMDTHLYVTNWKWDTDRTFVDTSITSMTNPRGFYSRMCVAGKPSFISEWDMPWPNPYRAESSIFYAAVACLHNWSGLAIHTYAYSTRVDKHDPLGRETTTRIGNSLGREGIFTVWNDWARFGLFYHAALMVRRGDVRPSDRKVAIGAADMRQHSDRAFIDTLELFKAAFTLEEEVPEGYETKILDTDAFPSANPKMRVSCTGQMRRHLTKQVGIVDSERTKIVYGTLTNAAGPDLAINDMEIRSATDFGVIALSSLTDDAITDSENMLLSAIGKVRNTGQICDGNHLAELGTTPIVAELIQADIRIKNRFGERMVVWGINAEGTYVQKMPTTCKDGWISFSIGDPTAPACYYLIFKE